MKGPFESRHTSSERVPPTAREHARLISRLGARSERRWRDAGERVWPFIAVTGIRVPHAAPST
jgi:hypothetical protein